MQYCLRISFGKRCVATEESARVSKALKLHEHAVTPAVQVASSIPYTKKAVDTKPGESIRTILCRYVLQSGNLWSNYDL